ncbi:hypothetical protein MBLNU230_g7481t1 [Neophaeotheca triangularis]
MANVGVMSYPAHGMPQNYSQQYTMPQTRAHHPREGLPLNPYSTHVPMQQPQPQLQPQPRQHTTSQPPNASAATEDFTKPSLPSISNLLGYVDAERPSQDAAPQQIQGQQQQAQSQQPRGQSQQQQNHPQTAVQPSQIHQRHTATFPQETSTTQRTTIPPTPPFRNDSIIEGGHSPSTISTGSSLSGPSMFAASAINNVEAYDQRIATHQSFPKRPPLPSHASASPWRTSPYSSSPYSTSPGTTSTGSYYSPNDAAYHSTSLYHQRPLPSNFPPPPSHHHNQHMPPPSSSETSPHMPHPNHNPWEHHHYISASSQATFPQSQDRYICQTCSKAFSRPSSLKIHTHSHTGEKPFQCPHAGCGKAFSVRSNMKRHERGCHTGGPGVGLGGMQIR